MGCVGDEVAACVLKLEAHGERHLLAGLGVHLHHLERRLGDVIVHECGRFVFALLADGGLPVLHGKKRLSPFGLEGVRHVLRDHLVDSVGPVCERSRPIGGLGPAVHVGVAVLGGGEPVLVDRDGAHAVAGLDELAGLGRENGLLGVVVELELHAGHENALDLLGHVAVRRVVDLDRHFLDQSEVAAFHGVGHLGRVVGVDGLADRVVLRDAHAEHLWIPAVPIVEVVALRSPCLLDEHGAERDRCVAVSLVVEGISRVLVLVSQVGESIGIRLEHPGARRRAGRLGRCRVSIVARVVTGGEERAFERRITFGLALVGIGVNLADEHSHGV